MFSVLTLLHDHGYRLVSEGQRKADDKEEKEIKHTLAPVSLSNHPQALCSSQPQ